MKDNSEQSTSPRDEPALSDFMQKEDYCEQCERKRIGKELTWKIEGPRSRPDGTGSERGGATLDVDEDQRRIGKAEASKGLFGKIRDVLGLDGGDARRERGSDREADRSTERDRVSNRIEMTVSQHDERLDRDPTYKVCRGHETADWTYAVEKAYRDRCREIQHVNERFDRRERANHEQRREHSRNENRDQFSDGDDRTSEERRE